MPDPHGAVSWRPALMGGAGTMLPGAAADPLPLCCRALMGGLVVDLGWLTLVCNVGSVDEREDVAEVAEVAC
ncbi:MAG: hypothetical protein DLM59_07650 [Pseudonocardiales bacterium]|nr:MAG: hypothetical protein DLM59_07650 [Pseudonocardiales bacterium]